MTLRTPLAAFLAFAALMAARPALAQPEGSTAKPPPSAQALLTAAIKTAKASNKSILVHFGASW